VSGVTDVAWQVNDLCARRFERADLSLPDIVER
jgi:hypothetical protein